MGSSVQADTKFFRRILIGLMLLTAATGAMAGLTTVEAMTDKSGACILFCE